MKKEPLIFNPSTKPFTLGVELELQVLDAKSLLLKPRVHEIIDALGLESLKKKNFLRLRWMSLQVFVMIGMQFRKICLYHTF